MLMRTRQRTALLVTYFYAPMTNPGTRRVEAFARYLPENGYRPLVLTTDARGTDSNDGRRGVFRAADLLRTTKRLVPGWSRPDPMRHQEARDVLAADSRMSRLLHALMVPDVHVGWLPAAVLRGLTLARSGAVDLIFSSSPPSTSHLVARRLKRITGLPWVADFRDGWLFEPPNRAPVSSNLRRRVERRLEAAVVRDADRLVTVNHVLAADLATRYPRSVAKIAVVSNGYDPADREGLGRRREPDGRLRLVYTGAIGLSRMGTSLDGLLAALAQLRERRAPVMDCLEVLIVGPLTADERRAIERRELSRWVRAEGSVEHRAALQHQLDADVLLLVTAPTDTSVTTSKLFEYLAADRPIFALASGSAAADLVTQTAAGVVVGPDNVPAIAGALERYHTLWRDGALPGGAGARAHRYDRRVLAAELAAIFEQMLAQPFGTGG
jgi:glycosyltransferase involved in cell wall biosynthesis